MTVEGGGGGGGVKTTQICVNTCINVPLYQIESIKFLSSAKFELKILFRFSD
jgi:hypothetical protein